MSDDVKKIIVSIGGQTADLESAMDRGSSAVEQGMIKMREHGNMLGRDVHRLEHHFVRLFSGLSIGFAAFRGIEAFGKGIGEVVSKTEGVEKLGKSFKNLEYAIGTAIKAPVSKFSSALSAEIDAINVIVSSKMPTLRKIAGVWSLLSGNVAAAMPFLGEAYASGGKVSKPAISFERIDPNSLEGMKRTKKTLEESADSMNPSEIKSSKISQQIDAYTLRIDKQEALINKAEISRKKAEELKKMLQKFNDEFRKDQYEADKYWQNEVPFEQSRDIYETQRHIDKGDEEEMRKTGEQVKEMINSQFQQFMATPDEARDLGKKWSEGLKSGIEQGLVGIGQVIGDAFSGQDIGKGALRVLGQFASTIGGLMISLGLAALTLKTGAWLANPVVAIAAGVALVAIGSAISGAASRGPSGGGSGGGGGYSSGGGNYSGAGMQVNVIGVLRGNDIYFSGQRGANSLSKR